MNAWEVINFIQLTFSLQASFQNAHIKGSHHNLDTFDKIDICEEY